MLDSRHKVDAEPIRFGLRDAIDDRQRTRVAIRTERDHRIAEEIEEPTLFRRSSRNIPDNESGGLAFGMRNVAIECKIIMMLRRVCLQKSPSR